MTIRTDVPVDVDFESLRYRGASRERCYELFTRLAFRTLVNDYAPTADTIQKDYALVTTESELDALVAELRAAGEFAICVITDQPNAMRATIVGIAVSHCATGRRDTSRSAHRSEDERRSAGERVRTRAAGRESRARAAPAAARGRGDRQTSATI